MPDPTVPGIIRQPYPPRARLLSVARAEDLSPDMRRIVLTGDDLEPSLPFPRLAPADHVKLVIPDEATGEVVLPQVGQRGQGRPDFAGLTLRDYTIRSFDAGRRELTLDFVLHDDGPAGRWAAKAGPGMQIGVLGPRGTAVYPDGYDRYVIGADEAALPATERWIEEAPDKAKLEVFALVADASRERPLPAHPQLTLRWLHRDAGDDLAGAIQQAVPKDDGRTYVWVSAESGRVQPLRRHLLGPAGFDRARVDVHGYWKAGVADHHEPGDPEGAHGHQGA